MSLKFAANLSYLFAELPFLDRFAAARDAGFAAVEFHFPYAWPPAGVAAAASRAGVEVVLFNLPAGDWEAGDRGIACQPARIAEFRDGIARALDHARALGCRRLNCLAGIPPQSVAPARVRETLIENLRFAAAALTPEGIALMLEPINRRDMPGFLLATPAEALTVMDAVGSDNLFLQYDVYHAQVSAGDLANTVAANLGRIGHIQVADNPGRHEPGTGEINYDFLFRHLDRLGYRGWIGCEYIPAAGTVEGLDWLRQWR